MLVLGYLAAITSPTRNLDYQSYQTQYMITQHQPAAAWKFEKGYSWLNIFFGRLGFDYQAFRCVVCFLAVLIMYVGVRRLTKNTALFAGIYGITVFLLDATQIRNFIMVSFVVLAVSFLVDKSTFHLIVAFGLILLGAQFHSLGYIFLLLIPMRLIPFRVLYRYTMGLVSASLIIILGLKLVGVKPFLKVLAKIVSLFVSRASVAQKIASQYGNGSVLVRYVAVVVATLMAFFLVWFLYRIISTTQDERLLQTYQTLYRAMLLAVLMLPTLSLDDDYARIPRSLFLFAVIGIALFYENREKIKLDKMFSLVTFVIIIVCIANSFTHLLMWGPAFRSSLVYLIHLA